MPSDTRRGSFGVLWLVPTPLDFGIDADAAPLYAALPMETIEKAAHLSYWICENAKSLRAFLKRVDAVVPLALPIAQMTIQELPRSAHKLGDHAPGMGLSEADCRQLLLPLESGHDIGFASEAGLPCVADPGSSLVRYVHAHGKRVEVLNGSSALLLALAASGLDGQNFAFAGYLPVKPEERRASLLQLQQHIWRTGQTQIIIETPFRNQALLDAALAVLDPELHLCVAAGLGTAHAWTRSAPVVRWREARQGSAAPDWTPPSKCPAVFILGAAH